MARLAAWVALAAVGAAAAGCGPGKELPTEVVPQTPAAEKPAAVPAASDPAAAAYAEKAARALTGGKPELTARAKVGRAVMKGSMALPVDNELVPLAATRTLAAVWPDRFYAANELTVRDQPLTVRTWLRGGDLVNQPEQDPTHLADLKKSLPADVLGQYWMALLVPLADPKAVLFDLQPGTMPSPRTGEPTAVQRVKLALGDHPLYQLTFDAKTDLLVRVEYTVKQGVRRRTTWTALEHKPGPDGLVLPTRTECRHDAVVVEQWAVEKWEFPAAIDDAEFAPLVKK